MTPPTLVTTYEPATNWSTTTTPKTASVTTAVGDLLVCCGITANGDTTLGTPTGGTGLTWTLRQSHTLASHCAVYAWTAPAVTAESFTASIARAGNTSNFWGFEVFRFSGHGGYGSSNKASDSASGAPLLDFTTTGADSALVYVSADWNAVDGASRTYRTGPGTITETSYFRSSVQYTIYVGCYANAGAIGTKATGLTAPTGQEDTIIVVEVLGVTGTASRFVAPRRNVGALVQM